MTDKLILVGWRSVPAADALPFSPVRPPSNYGQEAAAKYVEKKEIERRLEAAATPFVARIESALVHVYDGKSGLPIQTHSTTSGSDLMAFLLDQPGPLSPGAGPAESSVESSAESSAERPARGTCLLVGFGLEQCLAIAGAERLRSGAGVPCTLVFPDPRSPRILYDLWSASIFKHGLDRLTVLQTILGDSVPLQLHSPINQVDLAYRLSWRLGLFSSSSKLSAP
jgi:hypothetical protein